MTFIFEGEKDVERGWDHRLLATCNVGRREKLERRTERASQESYRLYRADNDKAGTNHAQKVYASLTKSGIDCFILWDYREGLPDKGDFCDWMDANKNGRRWIH